jgi:hypothetical protein
MCDVIAPLYSVLLQRVKQYCKTPSLIISLFPSAGPPRPWSNVFDSLLPLVRTEDILWTEMGGGRYVKILEAVVIEGCELSQLNEDSARVVRLLLEEDVPVCLVPRFLVDVLIARNYAAGSVGPVILRKHYRSRGVHQSLQSRGNAMFILRKCVKDLDERNLPELQGRFRISFVLCTFAICLSAIDRECTLLSQVYR